MRVAIIGAGIAGLACARELRGHDVVIYEKSRGVGGRVNTRKTGEFVWDTGATSIAPRGKRIQSVMLDQLDSSHLHRIELPIAVHSALRVMPGNPERNSVPRYVYTNGIAELPKQLAANLDIRFERTITEIKKVGAEYEVEDERFDAVVLTPPIPQTAQLLWTLDESRPIANVKYRTSLSVLLAFESPNPTSSYHALIDPEQAHPLLWLSIDSAKSPNRAPLGSSTMVAQLSARYSHENYSHSDEEIVETTLKFLTHLYGDAFSTPVHAMVKKWKYSQPETIAQFDAVNIPGSKILIASDGLLGGRIEDAYECGAKVADLLNHG